MMKVITEFGVSDQKSLLVELPQFLLDGIDVEKDGTVNTESFIKILIKYQEHKSSEMSAVDRINIYDAIFNPARAVQQRGKLM